MSNLNQASKVTQQSLVERIVLSVFSTMFNSRPARVTKYDKDKQLAEVELAFVSLEQVYSKRNPTQKPTFLSNVPVLQPASLIGGVVLPINNGDEGLCIFLDRSKDNWLSGLFPSVPNCARMHDVNDAIFIPGLHNVTKSLQNVDNESTTSFFRNAMIRIKDTLISIVFSNSGKVKIANNLISLLQQQQDQFAAQRTTLLDIVTALNALNASIQLVSNITLPVPSAGLISGGPGAPVTGSAVSSPTPTLPPVSTANLVTDIANLTAEAQKLSQILSN